MDLILRNLTKRPNVRSTLILSRKDGSIIKASGAIADDDSKLAFQDVSYRTVSPAKNDQILDGNNEEAAEGIVPAVKEDRLSRAQILAVSIYSFVSSATNLAESLRKADLRDTPTLGKDDITREKHDQGESVSQSENDVQLLRLRLKKQESTLR